MLRFANCWSDGEIHQAYTTVMTTMDRLYKKGLLDRVAEGRAFRYIPRHTPEELQRVTALESIRQLLGSGEASCCLSRIWWKPSAPTTLNFWMNCNYSSNVNAAN